MTSLNKKLFRDLWSMKGQALAIGLVMASGASTFVMAISTRDSLEFTRVSYYAEKRFPDVFASLKRAPESLKGRLRAIPGVQQVETRVIAPANLEVEDYPDPVTGRLVSIPDFGEPLLNGLHLMRGRLPDSVRDDEVVVHDSFARAHEFEPGDRIVAVINGRRKRLRIVGIALSPEHVFPIQPGSFIPDDQSYGVMWMARTPIEAAYDMEGAFNDVSLSLAAGVQLEEVIDRVDELLDRYGGLGAYGRADQPSHRFLNEEMKQLNQMATLYPVIFLGVAAFLLNVVVSRLIRTQREQVATLKAFGYSNAAVGWHFMKLVLMMVALGVGAGVWLGEWFGQGMSAMYMDFYRFPYLRYELEPHVAITAAAVTAGAAIAGTFYSVREAARQPPAEAMRPEPPAHYRETLFERIGFKRWLSQPARMIARNIERQPVKSSLAAVGIALACAILMMGFMFNDLIENMILVQYGFSQRDDMTVTFVEPTSMRVMNELQSLPGVKYLEPLRAVPARLTSQHRGYRVGIQGLRPGNDLYRLLDQQLATIDVPPEGVLLTDWLGSYLDVRVGDTLRVETLEGARPVREVVVAGLVSQFVGVSAYMHIDALNRMMREGRAISGVFVAADSRYEESIYDSLKRMPRVAGVTVRTKALANLEETMAQQMLVFGFFITLLASTIAFGVVYNTARISLSERSRELASLRVLGLTRGEISFILLGELGVLTLAAIPLGFVFGRALCGYVTASLQNELFRFPVVLEPSTYSFAATVVMISACVSALIVRRRLDHLDLVAVLKTKE